MESTIDKLVTASHELQEIYVKGQDSLRMATALTLIEYVVRELSAAETDTQKEG